MPYTQAILNFAPDNWSRYASQETDLDSGDNEFKQMSFEARQALQSPNKSISKITRIQNVHDLGQMLIREQLLVVANQDKKYYRVRRFIKIKPNYYKTALKYNLDHRRCGLAQLKFESIINYFGYDDVLVAVQVVTATPNSDTIIPSNSLEYFIDYVVFFN